MNRVLAASIIGLIAWCAIVCVRVPQPIVDEAAYHLPAIQALTRGDWGPARGLPMPPVYHWLASIATRPFGGELWAVRAFNAAIAALTFAAFAWALRARGNTTGGAALARFALLPVALPFWVLAYTDVPALLGVVAGVALHARMRYVLAALALAAAIAMRQSNLVWPALFALWTFTESPSARGENVPRSHFARVRAALPYVVVLLVGALAVLPGGPLSSTLPPENRPGFNVAQLFGFFLVASVLRAPTWLADLRRDWRAFYLPHLMRPSRCAGLAVIVAALGLAYQNPHPWNADLSFARNWVLVGLTDVPVLRFLAAAWIVLFALAAGRRMWAASNRGAQLATWGVALAFVLAHPLVDPRYYIVPCALIDFVSGDDRAETWRATRWYAVLSAGIAALLLLRPHGGLL